ncbi:hypothetical protein CFC21_066634 [Triticum aestivum]|uniref:Uncharacterized protein n=3 Tax=Triticum TaxID=4564 RepID=A0A9R0TV71_TRITD|nr:uncharacterized protein LOC123107373 [Triticum aestivum]XP_048526827.1 uncharacterized protein LOC125505976 [Triticum urartu]XP_048575071.1 uncharacterized protein LOC125556362 [Triticum urartu]KAF7059770.1 hypothetical protein CFC21_066634 [Triticum aestivum]VAI19529.1 unnamed protein product [Triticum turgidum subsp. durum]
MAKARRRRVPAFGEWNYNYHHDEPEATAALPPAACNATPEPEACSDVWFRYSPPPRKPTPKKQARRRPEGDVSRERSKASRDAAAAKSGGSRRVVRPVNGDLYQVPPPELAPHRAPRKTGSLWMGCLGLSSCVH